MRRPSILLLMLLPAACAGAGPEPAASKSRPPECFNVSMVQGFNQTGPNRLRVDAGPRQSYDIEISGPQCDRIEWSQSVLLRASASSMLCAGASLGQGDVAFHDLATGQSASCHIDAIRPVAPDEPR